MSRATSHLWALVDLARQPSGEKRRELLRKLVDAFLDRAPSHSEAERDHFGAILSSTVADVDVATRRNLAKQFANVPSAPRGLIVSLAHDEDFIAAREVLLRSAVLTDDDLIAVVCSEIQDRLDVIAARHTVSAAVSAALVEHGDDQVVAKLIANNAARISHAAFERIVQRSRQSKDLEAVLIARVAVAKAG